MKRLGIDDGDFGFAGAIEFIQLARGLQRAPQAGEARTDHKDSFQGHSPEETIVRAMRHLRWPLCSSL